MKLRLDLLEQLTDEDILEEVLANNHRYKAEPLFSKTGVDIGDWTSPRRAPPKSPMCAIRGELPQAPCSLWRQVLEYFDASLIGLTATPSKQTFGFFQQNLGMEYNHEKAVADGVNVGCDIYRIKTQITEAGSKVEAGLREAGNEVVPCV